MAGRKRIIDSKDWKSTEEKFLNYLKGGNYIEDCCKLVGISRYTFYDWVGKAKAGDPDYKAFMIKVEQAQAEAIANRLARIERAGELGDWKADAWWLERVYKDKFAADTKVIIETKIAQEVEAFVQKAQAVLPEQDFARLMAHLSDDPLDKEDFVNDDIHNATNVRDAEIVPDDKDGSE